MSERLIIKNFGPIKEMSFDFQKINILIGEQSTGKSTVAKLLSVISQMIWDERILVDFYDVVEDTLKEKAGEIDHFRRLLRGYEIETYLTELTEISYEHSLFKFRFLKNNCSLRKLSTSSNIDQLPQWGTPLFIPADRAAVNLLSNELLYSLNEIRQDLPLYFSRFGQMFNRAKKDIDRFDFSDTLGVIYKYENSSDRVEILNKSIKLVNASSAMQTNIPLLVLIQYQSKMDNRFPEPSDPDLNVTVIEEPELNCFPHLQYSILKYIITCNRSFLNRFTRRILITTHSPYILTSLNNLMYAYRVGQDHKEEVSKIIEEKYWVNPNDVSAYQLLTNGTAESIIADDGLIMAERIDSVSGIINREYDLIQNIELGIEQ